MDYVVMIVKKTYNSEKRLKNNEYCPQSMLAVANSFFCASEVCDNLWTAPNDKEYEQLLIPIFVNGAIACELFIKAILQIEQIELDKSHNLKKLFDSLPKTLQTELRSHYDQIGCPFEEKIALIANSFEEIRYAYEFSSLAVDPLFLESFAKQLKEIATRKINTSE